MLALPHFHSVALAVAQSGGDGGALIALLPVQYARTMAEPLGLALDAPPIAIPVPEISIYWHRRCDADPAQRWLREQVRAAIGAIC